MMLYNITIAIVAGAVGYLIHWWIQVSYAKDDTESKRRSGAWENASDERDTILHAIRTNNGEKFVSLLTDGHSCCNPGMDGKCPMDLASSKFLTSILHIILNSVTLPYEVFGKDHNYFWFYLIQIPDSKYIHISNIVKKYCELYPVLLRATNVNGVACIHLASDCNRAILARYLYFCGRYELDTGPAVHCSDSTMVLLATDHSLPQHYEGCFLDNENMDRELFRRVIGTLGAELDLNHLWMEKQHAYMSALSADKSTKLEASTISRDVISQSGVGAGVGAGGSSGLGSSGVGSGGASMKVTQLWADHIFDTWTTSHHPNREVHEASSLFSPVRRPSAASASSDGRSSPTSQSSNGSSASAAAEALDLGSPRNRRSSTADQHGSPSASAVMYMSLSDFVKCCISIFGRKRRVAIKMMRERSAYDTEVSLRSKYKLDRRYIVSLLSDVPTKGEFREGLSCGRQFGGKSTRDLSDFRCVVVMPAGDRDLDTIFRRERPQLAEITDIMYEIGRALSHLHSKGLVYGDLKMNHVVRMHDRYRLVDLDSVIPIGSPCCARFSTGILPPEAFQRLKSDNDDMYKYFSYWKDLQQNNFRLWNSKYKPVEVTKTFGKANASITSLFVVKSHRRPSDIVANYGNNNNRNNNDAAGKNNEHSVEEDGVQQHLWRNRLASADESIHHGAIKKGNDNNGMGTSAGSDVCTDELPYKLLSAEPTLDIWAFGLILYALCSGKTLIPLNRDSDVQDNEGFYRAVTWTDEQLRECILKNISVDKSFKIAQDLLLKIFRCDPKDRLQSMGEVLSHTFFTSSGAQHAYSAAVPIIMSSNGDSHTDLKSLVSPRSSLSAPVPELAVRNSAAPSRETSGGVVLSNKNLSAHNRSLIDARGPTKIPSSVSASASANNIGTGSRKLSQETYKRLKLLNHYLRSGVNGTLSAASSSAGVVVDIPICILIVNQKLDVFVPVTAKEPQIPFPVIDGAPSESSSSAMVQSASASSTMAAEAQKVDVERRKDSFRNWFKKMCSLFRTVMAEAQSRGSNSSSRNSDSVLSDSALSSPYAALSRDDMQAFIAGEKVYLYLVDEVTMKPVVASDEVGDIYPIELSSGPGQGDDATGMSSKSTHAAADLLLKLFPLIHNSFNALVSFNNCLGIAQCFGYPENCNDANAMKSLMENFDVINSGVQQHQQPSAEDSRPSAVKLSISSAGTGSVSVNSYSTGKATNNRTPFVGHKDPSPTSTPSSTAASTASGASVTAAPSASGAASVPNASNGTANSVNVYEQAVFALKGLLDKYDSKRTFSQLRRFNIALESESRAGNGAGSGSGTVWTTETNGKRLLEQTLEIEEDNAAASSANAGASAVDEDGAGGDDVITELKRKLTLVEEIKATAGSGVPVDFRLFGSDSDGRDSVAASAFSGPVFSPCSSPGGSISSRGAASTQRKRLAQGDPMKHSASSGHFAAGARDSIYHPNTAATAPSPHRAKKCEYIGCKTVFGVLKRHRHHCRVCGLSICDKHTFRKPTKEDPQFKMCPGCAEDCH